MDYEFFNRFKYWYAKGNHRYVRWGLTCLAVPPVFIVFHSDVIKRRINEQQTAPHLVLSLSEGGNERFAEIKELFFQELTEKLKWDLNLSASGPFKKRDQFYFVSKTRDFITHGFPLNDLGTFEFGFPHYWLLEDPEEAEANLRSVLLAESDTLGLSWNRSLSHIRGQLVNLDLIQRPDLVRELIENSVLSNEAKKYAIQTKLRELSPWLGWSKFTMAYFMGGCSLANGLGYFISGGSKWKKKPFWRIALGGVSTFTCVLVVYGLYPLARRLLETYYVENGDRDCVTEFPDYLNGGLEYLVRQRNFNIALRELLGHNGPELFATNGDIVPHWHFVFSRTSTPRLSRRIEHMEALKKKMEEEGAGQENPA